MNLGCKNALSMEADDFCFYLYYKYKLLVPWKGQEINLYNVSGNLRFQR